MDVNLTNQIATNLIRASDPLMNISAGIIGGFVTGSLTLIGVWMTLKNYEKRDDRNRKHDAYRSKREELKKVYIDLLLSIEKTGVRASEEEVDHLIRSLSTTILLGSDDITGKIGNLFEDYSGKLSDPQKRRELVDRIYPEIAPLMRQELKDMEKASQ